jgi:large subunit ribosomal protein L35
MKTRKSITKRFKITKNGKIMRRLSGSCHLRQKKSGNRIRKGRKWVALNKSEAKKIRKLLIK